MKINSSNGLERYQSYVQQVKNSETSPKEQGKVATAGAKTDTVTISGDAAARAEVSRLTAAVSAEVEQFGAAGRLEELRTAVQTGSYSVAAEDVASAMLDIEA